MPNEAWSGTQWWTGMCPTGTGHTREGIIAALATRCLEPQCKGRMFSPMRRNHLSASLFDTTLSICLLPVLRRFSDRELDVWDGSQAHHMFCFTNSVGSSKEISREMPIQFQEILLLFSSLLQICMLLGIGLAHIHFFSCPRSISYWTSHLSRISIYFCSYQHHYGKQLFCTQECLNKYFNRWIAYIPFILSNNSKDGTCFILYGVFYLNNLMYGK
jgi:hypothetical protein